MDDVLVSKERRSQWDARYPLFRLATESWSLWLYNLGPATYQGNSYGLIKKVLDLARAIIGFSNPKTLKGWVTRVLIYFEDVVDDLFSMVVAKAFRSVMIWLSNHEEFFQLKARPSSLQILPCSRRHVEKYLNMSKSQHQSKLDKSKFQSYSATA